MLGVVTGLKSEAKLLKGLTFACVSTGGQAREARRKIDRLIADGATGLVSFGIAGALSPDLKTGDLVIADMVVNDIGEVWQTHRPWVDGLLASGTANRQDHHHDDVPHHAAARRSEGHSATAPLWSSEREDALIVPPTTHVTPALSRGPSVRQVQAAAWIPAQGRDDGRGKIEVGAILGMDHMIGSPGEKATALARSGALAIDMESHHVARAAGERGMPFLVVRAVSDQAQEVLPAIMATFVDAEGQTKMSAVLAALISGRVKLGELLQAGRASKRAHEALLRCRGALAGLR